MLKHNYDIRDLRHDSHEHNNVGMPQNTLHHDLILNFLEEVVRYLRVKYLLNSTRRVIERSFVNDRESSLANLFSELHI